ncbi:hydantoinase B/oxoprolinase family protein [Cyanobacterium stanieri LEGE 03274]|uniref:Hydantoinase B/oxoprolinase family protein n=1 Tax=Cyanobacterium stanieri LEGE 03274 TaxID=1828756 RepID=A0ABR9V4N9_9CHRO|nr:hydantoinase B/oxoprolinase family protein [Cyanobacterium stanieri LEGE 03274]
MKNNQWQFWIDRGGTFTDVVALNPEKKLITHKLLSENPSQYTDAAVEGIRVLMNIPQGQPIPLEDIEVVKMGTTVATNALLERKGERVVLVTNEGFRDALRIGYQHRPNIFAREIVLPSMVYEQIIEVSARYSAHGEELSPIDEKKVIQDLQRVYDLGIKCCAVVLLHGYRYTDHEKSLGAIAHNLGFTQISLSHEVSPLMKLVSRGDTTVVDAYLSPILRRYVEQVQQEMVTRGQKDTLPKLMFMQSNGGLVTASQFQGKDSILSGPAGGIVGAVKTCQQAGINKIVTFDMGGTSTDVAHFNGEYERTLNTEIAGIRLRTPMMSIDTVAAGGGSICTFDGLNYRVGPESAGANPGPACYGKGGDLTITDCNLFLGKIQAQFFPQIFGNDGKSPLDIEVVKQKFIDLQNQLDNPIPSEEIASGFLQIAVEKMAIALKKVSLQKGYNISEYTLCCFGGAGGQHACLIAESLGIKTIIIHPLAGVLSAYGIGLADIRIIKEKSQEKIFTPTLITTLNQDFEQLKQETLVELSQQVNKIEQKKITYKQKIYLKYQGTDSPLEIDYKNYSEIIQQFNQAHKKLYGFILENKPLIVEQISLELINPTYEDTFPEIEQKTVKQLTPITHVQLYSKNQWHNTPVFQRQEIPKNQPITGPALIIESTGTNVIELGWQGEISTDNNLMITAVDNQLENYDIPSQKKIVEKDLILLEIFNNLFRFIAEEMGITLQKTSYSVNIKERLDFSCAIFDQKGQLVANAPHIPVHLGSMGETVKALINSKGNQLRKGDVYITNNPYNGGTHLPDITAITPIFINSEKPDFFVASRGHHSDIGGITPGSMPPMSKTIEEEGILIDNFCLVEAGKLREKELRELLTNHPYPVRNYQQNVADLQAQIAANEKGLQELTKLADYYGLETVKQYMDFAQENAEECVKDAIKLLKDGRFTSHLDNGAKISVTVTINDKKDQATIDFTGTSAPQDNNFNAPMSVCKAVVLYVFRTLVDKDIPLNAGCLKPLEIIIPPDCFLNPQYPCAVVAGNVETSQQITNCLYAALGIMANSQGTMNNFTFGNEKYQYYETICGGSGAGYNYHGTDAIQTHMTNSRLTDPEVLEWRFPVRLDSFSIRKGSGGKGDFRGGDGVIRQIRFLESMTAGILSSHRLIPPSGLNGGGKGMVGKNYLIRESGKVETLGATAEVQMNVNDIFVIETPGGGGINKLHTTS